MLGSQALDLGPFNIPVWLIAAAGGYLAAMGVQKLFLHRHKAVFSLATDLITSGVLVALAVWKLAPLVTRFGEIVQSPLRLLYYPGGTAGLLAGILAGLAFVTWSAARRRRRGDESALHPGKLVLAAAITAAAILAPVAVVSIIPAGERAVLPSASVSVLERTELRTVDIGRPSGARATVLVFWATWCGPCTAQMPEIQRYHESLSDSVDLFAVNLITTENDTETVASYVDSGGYSFPVVLDSRDELRSALAVAATPTVLIFDADGFERARRTGAVTADWIERRVLPLLQ